MADKNTETDCFNFSSYVEAGKKFFEQQEYSSALEQYEKILKKDAQSESVFFEAGKTHYVMGNYPEAMKLLKKAVEIEPDDNNTRILLSKVYMAQGDESLAMKSLSRIIEECPENSEAHLELARVYKKKRDYDLAIKELKQAFNKNIDNDSLKSDIHFELGRCYCEIQKYDMAIEEFKQELNSDPDNGQAHAELGMAYDEIGESRAAIKELEKAINLKYENDDIHLNSGRLYRELEEYDLSVKEFGKAIGMNSNTEEPYFANKFLNEIEISERKTVLDSRPRGMVCALTTRCNSKCVMCDLWQYSWDMPRNRVEEIMGLFPYMELIVWQGGEVFLSKYFDEIIDEAMKFPHLRQSITTNGLLINEKRAQKLVRSNIDLTFSIDGVTRDVYEKIRKGSKFEVLLKNIKRLNKYRRDYPGKMIGNTINVVVMKSNIKQLIDFPDFAKNYGFDTIRFTPVEKRESILMGAENIFESNDRKSLDYLSDIMPEVFRRAKEYNVELISCVPVDRDEKNTQKKQPDRGLLCYLPWQFLVINWGGRVIPYCYCLKEIGNVCENSIMEIWNNDMMQLYRRKIVENDLQDVCSADCITGVIPKKILKKQFIY